MTIDEVITMLNSEDCKLTTDICLMRYKVRDCWKCILEKYTKTVYNKAIDDMKEKLMQNGFIYTQHALDVFNEIAEQLKEGVDNEISGR